MGERCLLGEVRDGTSLGGTVSKVILSFAGLANLGFLFLLLTGIIFLL